MFSEICAGAAMGAVAGGLVAASQACSDASRYQAMGYDCSPNPTYILDGAIGGAVIGGVIGATVGIANNNTTTSNMIGGAIDSATGLLEVW